MRGAWLGRILCHHYALPVPNRASPKEAIRFIENIEQHLSFVSLTREEYRQAIRLAAAIGIAGGTTYDYLHTHCALKARPDVIYTWNLKHYQLFGSEIRHKLRIPA